LNFGVAIACVQTNPYNGNIMGYNEDILGIQPTIKGFITKKKWG
jgi:hypothetical protein